MELLQELLRESVESTFLKKLNTPSEKEKRVTTKMTDGNVPLDNESTRILIENTDDSITNGHVKLPEVSQKKSSMEEGPFNGSQEFKEFMEDKKVRESIQENFIGLEQTDFSRDPAEAFCVKCEQKVTTETKTTFGSGAIFCTCCVTCCVPIPLIKQCDRYQDTMHTCPECKEHLGSYKLINNQDFQTFIGLWTVVILFYCVFLYGKLVNFEFTKT